ncbi:MAG TPA: hypothetical protein VK619_19635 [Pyrinomonadaceae bacterium]|nr:hypothetical protein [Pyrinomonadaceae bacterium]
MSRGKSVDAVLAEADQIMLVWDANADFKLGEITKERFQTMIANMRQAKSDLASLRTLLTEKTNITNDTANELNSFVVRIRGGIKAVYGANSSQYEQAGGTRSSERKSPKRKPDEPKS